jgi:hypothetical protein
VLPPQAASRSKGNKRIVNRSVLEEFFIVRVNLSQAWGSEDSKPELDRCRFNVKSNDQFNVKPISRISRYLPGTV